MLAFIRRHRTAAIIIVVAIIICAWNITTKVIDNETAIAKTAEENRIANEKILASARATRARIDFVKARTAAANDALTVATAARNGVDQQPATMTPVCAVKDSTALTVVVNKKNCLNPLNYQPVDIVTVQGIEVRQAIQTHLTALLTAAADANVPITLTSGYRSYSDQIATYNSYVKSLGSTAAADRYASRQGYSEHQTGLAIDVKAGGCALECFGDTAQYRWLQAHAAEYGFIQHYTTSTTSITGYSAEPWHWRYVGPDVATAIVTQSTTLEQYFNAEGGEYS